MLVHARCLNYTSDSVLWRQLSRRNDIDKIGEKDEVERDTRKRQSFDWRGDSNDHSRLDQIRQAQQMIAAVVRE